MDDDSANTDGPSHINRRLRNKIFNHRAADMSDSAHDIANQLVSRRPDESDHDDGGGHKYHGNAGAASHDSSASRGY